MKKGSAVSNSSSSEPEIDLSLHEKQALVLSSKATEILYGGSAGGGKSCASFTPIPTASGWTTMGEIRVGDIVLGADGKPTRVVAKSDLVEEDCYEVEFCDGEKIVAGERHEWVTETDKDRTTNARRDEFFREHRRNTRPSRARNTPSTEAAIKGNTSPNRELKLKDKVKPTAKTTKEIFETQKIRGGTRTNHAVLCPKPLDLPEADLLVDPYVLGVWLGDGSSRHGYLHFGKYKYEIVDNIDEIAEVTDMGPDNERDTCHKWKVGGLKKDLSTLGLIDNKHIPVQYLRASFGQRLELLQGLMDTDGGVNAAKGECEFCTSFPELAKGFEDLLASFGLTFSMSSRMGKYSGKETRISWRFRFFSHFSVFKLHRKRGLQKTEGLRATYGRRYIVSVRKVDRVPLYCIQVDNEDHLYLVGRRMVPTHNSHLMRSAAIIWAMQIPGIQIYLFRRTFPDLERNHINGPSSFPILLSPMIDSGYVKWDKQKYSFNFWNGSSIYLCHCQLESDRFKYQGAEFHVLMIDEMSQFTPVIYRYLRSRVRMVGVAVPEGVFGCFPKILAGTNPGGPCHNFIKANWVDAAPPMKIWKAEVSDGGMLRQFIPARLSDNPSMSESDPDYASRLSGLGDPALVKAMLEGDFNIVSGGMFDDIWDPSVHLIDPFKLPKSWYFDRAFDMGSSKPFSVGWFAESDGTEVEFGNGKTMNFPRGTLFQIGEWYGYTGEPDVGLRLTPTEIAEGIKEREERFREKSGITFEPGPADSAIWDADTSNKSTADYFEKSGVHWVKANKKPGSRIAGWTSMRERLKASTQWPMEKPGLFIFSNCKNTLRTLPVATRNRSNPEDVSSDFEDHALDMLRYRVLGGKMRVRTTSERFF